MIHKTARELVAYWNHRHYEDCPLGSPDAVKWVCDQGHWLAWETPGGERCPVINHDADADGRCVGRLSRPECVCEEARR